MLRRGLPRLTLSTLGPVGSYVVGSQVAGVVGGIVAASVLALGVFAWERRHGRPGLLAWLSLTVVAVQAVLGLWSASAYLYFLPRITVDILEGAAFCASAVSRRPLAWLLAREIVTLPPALIREPDVRRVFARITLLWGGYFTVRGLTCLLVLTVAGTNPYLLTRAVVDLPMVLLLVGGSLAYGLGRLHQLGVTTGGTPHEQPAPATVSAP